MFLNNKLKSIFLTLDGHNDPALNINWFEALKRGKICHKNWHSKNKELIQEKVFNLSKKIKANITPAFKLPKQYKELFFSDEGSLKKKLVKVILDGEIKKDKDFASLIILLNDKYYRKFEICYYLRLITELIDNELIFNSLCLSDLKKKKSFPHGWHNYNSDFLKYSFYENYKKDLSILKLLNYKKNRKPNKKNFNLDDGVQYKYFDRYSIYSYKHQIDRSKIQKNREIIKNELTALWVKSKWKNEEILFRNLKLLLSHKNVIPIKWHKEEKLKRQHLDIYFEIDKNKYGIEYQGEQHFKPIKFFGGIKAFNRRLKLDRLKKSRCSRAKINLITFNYNERIDTDSIVNKLKLIGINLLKERRNYA